MAALFFLLGAFWRRWFGGGYRFLDWPRWAKLGVCFAIAFCAAFYSTGDWIASIVAAGIITVGWVFSHGEYMDMGRVEGTFWNDFFMFSLRYGIVTICAGLSLMWLWEPTVSVFLFSLCGVLAGPAYAVTTEGEQGLATEVGEHLIGGMMIGALAAI
jgi:hypothetical protein